MFATAIIIELINKISENLYIYPGGTIAPLLHEAKRENMNLVVSKSEQGAGYMALAEAMQHHRPAFVAVTSGPGITNLITVIADAYYDSVPLIIFSGQVGVPDLNRSSKLRQRGFQEVPIIDMIKPITKKSFQPKSIDELSSSIHEAIYLSNLGRKGPILIDLPMNIQLSEIDDMQLENHIKYSLKLPDIKKPKISKDVLSTISNSINKAKKPVILLGAGAQEDWKEIRKFVQACNIPAITSLRGLGVLDRKNFYGWIGHTGTPWANAILFNADIVLVLGSRLDIRQTGSQTSILDKKTVIHVDIDIEELNSCRIKNTIKVTSLVKDFIKQLSPLLKISTLNHWKNKIAGYKQQLKLDDIGKNQDGINPKEILSCLNSYIKNKKVFITTGVGFHQHWVARYIDFDNEKCKLFTSAGHGTMGYGLPSAIGLKNINKDSTVICIDGDGSFQMNIQELALIKELNLNIKILVLDNNKLGIVSQFQNITFKDDPTTGHIINPDFIKISEAYQIKSFYLQNYDKNIFEQWLSYPSASLLHVKIKYDTPLSPMLMGGQELNKMWYQNEQ